MPLIIQLKNPKITLITEGELDSEFRDRNPLLSTQALFRCDPKGWKMLIPLNENTNVAFIKEISQKELERMEEQALKEMKEQKQVFEQQMKGQGSNLAIPRMVFPGGKQGRG